MKILKKLKAIRIKIYFEKKYFKVFVDIVEKQIIGFFIETRSLGGYLLIPLWILATGFVWGICSPFILLASIKFGERDEDE